MRVTGMSQFSTYINSVKNNIPVKNNSPVKFNKSVEKDDENKEEQGKLEKLSDYIYLPTALKAPMSDEEFIQKMIEQAKKDAKRGIFLGDEAKAIDAAYRQVGAPDRVGAIKSQFNSLFPNTRSGRQAPKGTTEIFSEGRKIAEYSREKGWVEELTPQEKERADEIYEIYVKAYKEACGGDIDAHLAKAKSSLKQYC